MGDVVKIVGSMKKRAEIPQHQSVSAQEYLLQQIVLDVIRHGANEAIMTVLHSIPARVSTVQLVSDSSKVGSGIDVECPCSMCQITSPVCSSRQ